MKRQKKKEMKGERETFRNYQIDRKDCKQRENRKSSNQTIEQS